MSEAQVYLWSGCPPPHVPVQRQPLAACRTSVRRSGTCTQETQVHFLLLPAYNTDDVSPAETLDLVAPTAGVAVMVELRPGWVHWVASVARRAQHQTLSQDGEQVGRTGGFGELKGRNGLRRKQRIRSSQNGWMV